MTPIRRRPVGLLDPLRPATLCRRADRSRRSKTGKYKRLCHFIITSRASRCTVAAVEDDLVDSAALLPLVFRKRECILEFLENDLNDAIELATFLGGR